MIVKINNIPSKEAIENFARQLEIISKKISTNEEFNLICEKNNFIMCDTKVGEFNND